MILADSGIPYTAIANGLIGLGSQLRVLLAKFEYTKSLQLGLLLSQSLPAQCQFVCPE
jgi:hypothetical protein